MMSELPMQISESMLDYYLSYLTVSWFAHHEFPPADMAEYAPLIEDVRKGAVWQGDWEPLRKGLEYLLSRAETDWSRYAGDRFPFTPQAARAMALHLYRTLWPDGEIRSGQPPVVDLIPRDQMDELEWWHRNKPRSNPASNPVD